MGIFSIFTQQHMNDQIERAEIRADDGWHVRPEINTQVNDQHVKFGGRLHVDKEPCEWVGSYGRDGKVR